MNNYNNNNKPSALDIAAGIAQYETSKDLAARIARGEQLSAEYSYLTYILHVAIAFATGAIVSTFISTVLGVVCGIVSFIISLIIHWHRCNEPGYFRNYRTSYLKRIVLYTVITVAVIIGIKMIA